jgi:hypothetical protein
MLRAAHIAPRRGWVGARSHPANRLDPVTRMIAKPLTRPSLRDRRVTAPVARRATPLVDDRHV